MKILVAEDDPVYAELLCGQLEQLGFDVTLVTDGAQAQTVLASSDTPLIAILDWNMPGLSGIEVCEGLKGRDFKIRPYLIILSANGQMSDIVEGLDAGADDYIVKPCHPKELAARVAVGQRMILLQKALAQRVAELEVALEHVKTLQGILPICSHCHSIRDDEESWQRIEKYLSEHANIQFSHSICPACLKEHYSELLGDDE